jgi:uncharacterized membrane protein
MAIGPGHRMAAEWQGAMRASDEDREHAAEVLKTGFVEGRLTKDEYDGHLTRVYSAVTRGELEVATAQLPGGGYALHVAPRQRTNPLAIAALACALGQPFTLMLSTIPAVVLGHVARNQIRRTGDDGRGLALAGLVLGWAGVVVILLFLVAAVFVGMTVTRSANPAGG